MRLHRGAGILLDATIVRALLVPAAVALFGRWNWWLPGPLARRLRSRPSAALQLPAPTPQPAGDGVFAGARVRLPEGDPSPPDR